MTEERIDAIKDLIEEARASRQFCGGSPVGLRFERCAQAMQDLLDARQTTLHSELIG